MRVVSLRWLACGVALMFGARVAISAAPATPVPPDIIALIDVETTGLDPRHHEMIDLGAVYVRPDGSELGRFFVRILPPHPERVDPEAAAVNGYDPLRWSELGAVTEAEAVQRWREFHARIAAGRPVTFGAFNAYFDQAFTDALLHRHGSRWRDWFHYQILDLPSMAFAQGARKLTGADVAQRYRIAAETRDPLQHTGATGAEFNLAIYRALLGTQESPAVQALWVRCARERGLPDDHPMRSRRFGDTAELTRALNTLILSGEKTITAGTPWMFAREPLRRPFEGGYSVLLDPEGTPLAVLRTTEVRVLPFDQVTEAYSQYEGKPVRPIEAWRRVHREFFERVLPSVGRAWSPDMPVALERFEVVCLASGAQ